jgi:PTH1 family peptidyl-tRNA hydrolase
MVQCAAMVQQQRQRMVDRYLIVGLGNPGRDYEKTRHNVGFWVVDELARRYQLTNPQKERRALTYSGTLHNKTVLLAKPQTYMNLSGEAVRALLDFYKIPLTHLIVVHDDLDVPLGTLRLRQNGSAGGQNGVKSIIQHVGTQEFARVRFGIGRPPGRMNPADYVLTAFTGDDAILAQEILSKATDAVERWLQEGLEAAMTAYNGDVLAKAVAAARPTPEQELEVALRAHQLAPNDPLPLEKMARLYKKLRRLDDAAQTHLTLAALHERAGRIKIMLYELESAVAIQPQQIELQAQIARWHEQHDNPKAAVQRWLKLAEYHAQNAETAAAHAALQEALRLNPQHPKALELQAAWQVE